jgi:hypothetical protein
MQIYKITNLVNNKIYIGKDTVSDKNYYGSGVLIKRAIEKYGIKNFKKEIIEECVSNDELCLKEKYWIEHFNSTNLKIGYNISRGGDGGDTLSNNPNLEIIKSKISNVRKGKKYEDLFSIDKVVQYKEKLAKNLTKRLKGKSLEELYGIKKAKEIKEKQSKTRQELSKLKPKKVTLKKTPKEIENKKIEQLKKRYYEINDFDVLKSRYFGYRKRKNLDLFIKVIGEDKYNKIVEYLEKPFKHKKESIEKIKNDRIKKFIERKNKLLKFLLNNPNKTRNDYYKSLNKSQISRKIRNFLHGELSYLLTENEKELLRKRPKLSHNISEETMLSIKTKLGKKVLIDNIKYISTSEASKILNIDRGTIRFRLKSDNYPNYKYL